MIDYNYFWRNITPAYDPSEAKAIAKLVLWKCCGLTLTDIYGCKDNNLSEEKQQELNKIIQRLQKKEPIQYILGRADFCGKEFFVSKDVLIPRPETEELVMNILTINSKHFTSSRKRPVILDACTGSGCIAISLAKDCDIWAFDNSRQALKVAQKNIDKFKVNIKLFMADALKMESCEELQNKTFDIIASNPPYICLSEKESMDENVLDFEPHEALFVKDSNPLIFYNSIADYALKHLKNEGSLWFEINPLHSSELSESIMRKGFKSCEIICDSFGKKRFCHCKI